MSVCGSIGQGKRGELYLFSLSPPLLLFGLVTGRLEFRDYGALMLALLVEDPRSINCQKHRKEGRRRRAHETSVERVEEILPPSQPVLRMNPLERNKEVLQSLISFDLLRDLPALFVRSRIGMPLENAAGGVTSARAKRDDFALLLLIKASKLPKNLCEHFGEERAAWIDPAFLRRLVLRRRWGEVVMERKLGRSVLLLFALLLFLLLFDSVLLCEVRPFISWRERMSSRLGSVPGSGRSARECRPESHSGQTDPPPSRPSGSRLPE